MSTLAPDCENYVGRTLVVEPQYGWGWVHQQGKPFADHLGTPPPFHLIVTRVYRYQGELRGIFARIREPGFLYDGFWLVSTTRHIGVWNFTDRTGHHNLLVCPEEPVEGKPKEDYAYPIWRPRGRPYASGFGVIRDQLASVTPSAKTRGITTRCNGPARRKRLSDTKRARRRAGH